MESFAISLAAVCLLLIANAFFVAAEFALVKAKASRLALEVESGSAAARLTAHMQTRLEPYLAACQLGITMASLGLGWIGEPAVAALLEPVLRTWSLSEEAIHRIAFLVGFLVFSSLHIVLGEQVPKSLAIRQSEPVSIAAAYPLQIFYLVAFPLTWLLDRASRGVLALFKVEEGTHAEVLTLSELKGVVATSVEHGNISAPRAEVVQNILALNERPVGWIMIPRNRVTALKLNARPEESLAIIRSTNKSRFPLLRGDDNEDVMGIILTKDLYQAMLQGRTEPWKDLETYCRAPLLIPERQSVWRALQTMRAERAHMAIIADEYGQWTGIVTLEDLLEEVVGEIMDETDLTECHYPIERLGEDRWLVDGLMPLADAQREFGLETDTRLDANTLLGLMMERLQKIPGDGDHLDEGELRLTVNAAGGRDVAQVLVERRSRGPME